MNRSICRVLVPSAALALLLTGCGGSSSPSAASTSTSTSPSSSSTSDTSSSASSTTDSGSSASSSTAPASSGGAAGGNAVAVLPTPAVSIGSGADKGSASRAKVKGAPLGLLGTIAKGKAYPVGKIGAQGEADSGTWPDACKLLSDSDIKTLLPRSGTPRRTGQHGSFLGGGETKHFASCKYVVREPGDESAVPSYFDIDLDAVGDSGAVLSQWKDSYASAKKAAAKYPDQFWDYSGGELGGAKCYYDGNAIRCAKGHFSFTVLGGYTKSTGGGNAAYAQEHGYVQQVLANVVKTLALRMS